LRFRVLGDKDLYPSNLRYLKSQNGPMVQRCLWSMVHIESWFRDSKFWKKRISVLPTRSTWNHEMDQRSRSIWDRWSLFLLSFGCQKSLAATSSQLHLIQRLAGFWHFSSRTLHHLFRSSRSPLLDLWNVKACAPTSNQTICGILHRDPMLDDVLSPKLLFASNLEDFLSLRRLGLRFFLGDGFF